MPGVKSRRRRRRRLFPLLLLPCARDGFNPEAPRACKTTTLQLDKLTSMCTRGEAHGAPSRIPVIYISWLSRLSRDVDVSRVRVRVCVCIRSKCTQWRCIFQKAQMRVVRTERSRQLGLSPDRIDVRALTSFTIGADRVYRARTTFFGGKYPCVFSLSRKEIRWLAMSTWVAICMNRNCDSSSCSLLLYIR